MLVITGQDIELAFVGALMGLLVTLPVTYLVIDRIVARNEKRKMEPLVKISKERMRAKLGLGSLTTFLITLVLDVRSSLEEKRALDKDVAALYVTKLKGFQSDLERLLSVYDTVLTTEVAHITGNIIAQIEHLQEDFQYLIEISPKPTTETHVDHIEHLILLTVQLTKKDLEALGERNQQIAALEKWLEEYEGKHVHPQAEEPIQVSGKHTLY